MIIFGTGSSAIQPKQLEGGSCPYCNTQNNMWIQGYKKYFHVFWIPFFPIGKKVYTVCGHCKGAFEEREIQNQELITSFTDFKNNHIKTPWYHFIGLIIFAIAVMLIAILPLLGK